VCTQQDGASHIQQPGRRTDQCHAARRAANLWNDLPAVAYIEATRSEDGGGGSRHAGVKALDAMPHACRECDSDSGGRRRLLAAEPWTSPHAQSWCRPSKWDHCTRCARQSNQTQCPGWQGEGASRIAAPHRRWCPRPPPLPACRQVLDILLPIRPGAAPVETVNLPITDDSQASPTPFPVLRYCPSRHARASTAPLMAHIDTRLLDA